MAAEKLYYVNQYQTTCSSLVRTCEAVGGGWEVTLDKTVFYPVGGGQPCDLGTLGGASVLDVHERNGEVVHLCNAPLCVGARVQGSIDWQRRFSLMQQHSGEHLVSGIIHRLFGYDNVGFHMGNDAVTIDFSGEITPEQMQQIEWEANEAVWKNIESEIFVPDTKALHTLPYRSKKELTGEVRLVRFPDYDLCACCGLHVARTGEIGLIKLLTVTRFRSGSRMEMLCGSRALQWMNTLAAQNHEISALLSAKPEQTAAAVLRQKEELSAANFRAAQMENEIFRQKASTFAGKESALLFEPPMSAASVRKLADALLQQCERCFVFAGENGSYQYAMGAHEGDIRKFLRDFHAVFAGKGGGKPTFVQGSVKATEAELSDFFAGNLN